MLEKIGGEVERAAALLILVNERDKLH